jgi:(p)ppGpp synthase/HD superfamily hydrolase
MNKEIELTGKLGVAFIYADTLHRKQKRKGHGGAPYICHPMAVASLILENGGDEDEAIAGLLHDVIEDQGATFEELVRLFGTNVATLVQLATHEKLNWKLIPKDKHQEVLKAQRLGLFKKIREAPFAGALVMGCDKLHNSRSLLWEVNVAPDPVKVLKRFRGGVDGTIWYYDEVGKAISSHTYSPALMRMGNEVTNYAIAMRSKVPQEG